jgi:hypothetical protein
VALPSGKLYIMETITLPKVVVPDVMFDPDEMLMNPLNIHLGEDIRNTDLIIDNIIDHLKQKGAETSWLFTVREFTHPEKVEWINSLPDASHVLQAEGNFIFPVTVHTSVMLKVAETLSGEPLYERKEVEKTLEKCLPAQS